MNKPFRWLHEQTNTWVAHGIVSPDQAARIRALYPEPAAGLPWAMLIFCGLGAVVVGLGVILLFAYNWNALPRGVKLAVIFGAMAAGHGAGIWRLRGDPRWRGLGEALCLLGTMMFGAAIWLIAQIYHMEEHYPTGFLLWGLGALALAWALPSAPQGMLAAVALAVWSGCEAVDFVAPVFWAPLALLGALVPLACRRDSEALLFVTVAASAVTALINAGRVEVDWVPLTSLSLGAGFVAVAAWSRQQPWFPRGAPVWRVLGWALFLLPAYLLSFPELAHELLGRTGARESDAVWHAHLWVPLALALAVWAGVWFGARRGAGRSRAHPWRYEEGVPLLAAVLAAVLTFVPLEQGEWLVAGLFNLLFLLPAVAWMARGCREGQVGPALGGATLLVLLTLARYFDLFESLAARGLAFLLVGVALLGSGIQFARVRRVRAGEQGGPP